jgi:isoleucyl-tRNA synthetase
MDKLYRDLTLTTIRKNLTVYICLSFQYVENFVNKSLESKMKAQTISSLVLSLRKKEMIKVRQPT